MIKLISTWVLKRIVFVTPSFKSLHYVKIPSKQAIAQIWQDVQSDSKGRGFEGEKSKVFQMVKWVK